MLKHQQVAPELLPAVACSSSDVVSPAALARRSLINNEPGAAAISGIPGTVTCILAGVTNSDAEVLQQAAAALKVRYAGVVTLLQPCVSSRLQCQPYSKPYVTCQHSSAFWLVLPTVMQKSSSPVHSHHDDITCQHYCHSACSSSGLQTWPHKTTAWMLLCSMVLLPSQQSAAQLLTGDGVARQAAKTMARLTITAPGDAAVVRGCVMQAFCT